MGEQKPIDPLRLARALVKNITGEDGLYSEKPVIPLYRTRLYRDGNKWGTAYMLETIGCNADCSHCYVDEALLRAKLQSPLLRERLQQLPGVLKGNLVNGADAIYDMLDARAAKLGEQVLTFELTGGEPSLFRGGIRRIAEQAQRDGVRIGVNSNGVLVASCDDYLSAFHGLEDTIEFFFSVKGTTPEEFQRSSAMTGEHYLDPFIAAKRVREAGFPMPYLGVMLDTIAMPETLSETNNALTRLRDMVLESDVAFDHIIWDSMTEQIFGNRFPDADRKMVGRGYWSRKTDGSLEKHTDRAAVRKKAMELFPLTQTC